MIRKWALRDFWGAPVGILAGVLALLYKYNPQAEINFSSKLNLYISILLCVTFASFPLHLPKAEKNFAQRNLKLWKYFLLQHTMQWGLGLSISAFIASYFTSHTQDFFGIILPAGFAGGHGTAAVVGSLFGKAGHLELFSLAMTMATIGAFASLGGGLIWIAIYGQNRENVERAKFNFPSFKILVFFTLVVIVSAGIKLLFEMIANFEVPLLAAGVVTGLLAKFCTPSYLPEQESIDNFISLVTSALVGIGICAIEIKVVQKYLFIVILMSVVALVLGALCFRFLGLRHLGESAFEKSLFTWGWSIGGIVFGLSLVEMTGQRGELLRKLALTYLCISPFEISLVLLSPYLLLSGGAPILATCLFSVAVLLAISIGRTPKSSN